MKPFNEMSFGEKIDWASGKLCLAIGEGKFRDAVYSIIITVQEEAYERGVAYGKEQAITKKKKGRT